MTMTKIEHIEVPSGGQTAIEFTNIPQTYTDLFIVLSLRAVSGTFPSSSVSLNTYGSGSYTRRQIFGNGSSYGSNTTSETELYLSQIPGSGNTANVFGNTQIIISNYTGSTTKMILADLVASQEATQSYQAQTLGLWNQTAAVTTVSLQTYGRAQDLAQYSSATLFGVLAGSDGTTTVT